MVRHEMQSYTMLYEDAVFWTVTQVQFLFSAICIVQNLHITESSTAQQKKRKDCLSACSTKL